MLMDLLTQQLGGNTLKAISNQLGADEQKTGTAISAALPMLLGALARNSSKPEGARSLARAVEKDHDGSVLDDLSGFLQNANQGPGDGILRHVLGNRRPTMEAALGQTSGLDVGSASQLLTMLAPVVMGALGKAKRQQNLGRSSLADMLRQESNQIPTSSQSSGLLSLLDSDGDGSVVDDVAGMLGRFLR